MSVDRAIVGLVKTSIKRTPAQNTARNRENREDNWPPWLFLASLTCSCTPDCFARAIGRSQPLDETHPKLAQQLLGVKGKPCRDAYSVTAGSKLGGVWQCPCGCEPFTRTICNATKRPVVLCELCLTRGTSRLEFETAYLLELYLGTEVVMQERMNCGTSVDLYVPKLGLAINVDPYYFHAAKTDTDAAVLSRMQAHFPTATLPD